MKIWSCKIGEFDGSGLPDGADFPMRTAVIAAYKKIVGRDHTFCFSGWGAELDVAERESVTKRPEARLPVTTPRADSFYDQTPQGRYNRDPAFRTLVDSLEKSVWECLYTPTELREAALLAVIHYEQKQVRSPFVVDFREP